MPAPRPLFALMAPLLAAAAATTAVASPASLGPVPEHTRGLVIVLRPDDVDELTRTALARVTGELAAARFQVRVVPLLANVDPTPQVETVAPESQVVAAFAIGHVTDPTGDTIAIWVCDRLGRRTTIQRMSMRGNNISQNAEVLALEAIELIRVSIAGLWPVPRSTPPETNSPLSAPGWVRPEISIGLGITGLKDVGMPAPQWMATLIGIARWPRGLAARGQLIGLGPSLTLSGTDGSATVHRALVALGPAWFFWSRDPLEFFVSVATGGEHVDVAGATPNPARGTHARGAWVPVSSAGFGGAAHLGKHISLCASIDGLWAWSKVDVLISGEQSEIADTRTKPFSRPGALVNVGLQANF